LHQRTIPPANATFKPRSASAGETG
jgi:hypothetical protein